MFKISAFQISDSIDLDSFSSVYTAELLYSDHLELFYEVGTEIYLSVYKYGVVSFFNFEEDEKNSLIKLLSGYCTFFYDSELIKEYRLDISASEPKYGFNSAAITYFDIDTLRVIMLNVAQSVALDCYFQQARALLDATSKHTTVLEKTGKLAISDKRLKQFVGKTHNLKNRIIENLYIIDSPPDARHDDYLLTVNNEMRAVLYVEKRSANIHRELQIIQEHLEYFSNVMSHGTSVRLEWIIIVLLFIFVINIIVGHFS